MQKRSVEKCIAQSKGWTPMRVIFSTARPLPCMHYEALALSIEAIAQHLRKLLAQFQALSNAFLHFILSQSSSSSFSPSNATTLPFSSLYLPLLFDNILEFLLSRQGSAIFNV
jgi:hypothetical protein